MQGGASLEEDGQGMTRTIWCLLAMRGAGTLLVSAMTATSLPAAIPQIERDALIALYNSTDGPNWTYNGNWLGPARTECTWWQVHCDSGGSTVIELQLFSNKLAGTIPPELGALSSLQRLLLDLNTVDGIPPELGNLSSLLVLDLGGNQLTSIPSELGNLSPAGSSTESARFLMVSKRLG